MIRGLKISMLVLAIGLAFSASQAPVAAAQGGGGMLTSDGPVLLTGTSVGTASSVFTGYFIGGAVSCHGDYITGAVNKTPHGSPMSFPETSLTLAPNFTNCSGGAFEFETHTLNGCDYVLKIGETIEAGKWAAIQDIICPEGQQSEIHLYSSVAHTSALCTRKILPQMGITGGFLENLPGGTVTLGGTFTGILVETVGGLCAPSKSSASMHLDVEFSGKNEGGEPTAIEVSDEE